MRISRYWVAGALVAGITAVTAAADNHIDPATMNAVKARQAHMKLYAFNISLLGGMAKGEIDYNADAASAAAGNLAALTRMDVSRMWPMGSDNAALGEATDALPAIWAEGSQVMDKGKALGEAAAAMEAAAGGGLEALQGAMGALGNSCGGCHKLYRHSDE